MPIDVFEDTTRQYEAENLFVVLIEAIFVEAQIDGDQLALAYCLVRANLYFWEH